MINEALLLLMLAAAPPRASRPDQDVDALMRYFGRVIDAEQDKPNLGIHYCRAASSA
jgi:hypothetical protein